MSDSKKPNDDDLDAFDDVLFSSSDEADEHTDISPKETVEPGFDGVLFIDEDEPAPAPKKPSQPKPQKVPTLNPEKADAPKTMGGLSRDLDAFEDVAPVASKTQDETDYSSEALFASDDDLEQALEQEYRPNAKAPQQEIEENEVTDALFTSEDDLEKALDDFTPEAKPPKKAAAAKAENHKPTLAPVDLKQYLQNFAGHDKPSAACWFADNLDAYNLDAIDASLLEFEWPEKAAIKAEALPELEKPWQRLKYQCQLHLGHFAPARELSLEFKTPVQKNKKHFPELLNHRQIQNVLARKGANINNSIAKVHQQLQWQNSCKLGFDERQRHISPIKQFILQANTHLLQRFIKQPLQSHDKEAVQTASLHMASIRLLLQSYRILIAKAYSWPKALYHKRQQTFKNLLLDYINLAHSEAFFAAAAHMQVSNITAKSLNKVQQIIEQDEPSLLTQAFSLPLLQQKITVQSAFGFWQMLYALDLASLPTALLPALVEYLHSQQQDDWQAYTSQDTVPEADYLQWQKDQDTQAICGQGSCHEGYALLLSPLFNAIKQDYMLLLEVIDLQQQPNQQPWSALNWADKTVLANFLMQSMQLLQSGFKPAGKYSVYRPENLHLGAGFQAIKSCLENKENTTVANPKAVIGSAGVFKTPWQVAFADAKQMFIQAEESQVKQALLLGDSVLIEQQDADENWQLSLWVIKRLLRDELGAVQLQLEAIAQKPLLVEDASGQPYCLGFNEQDQGVALTQNLTALPSGAVAINHKDQQANIALKHLQFFSNYCQVFALQK